MSFKRAKDLIRHIKDVHEKRKQSKCKKYITSFTRKGNLNILLTAIGIIIPQNISMHGMEIWTYNLPWIYNKGFPISQITTRKMTAVLVNI